MNKKNSVASLNQYKEKIAKTLQKLNDSDKERLSGSLYIIFTLITISFFGIFAINPTLTTISNLQKQKQDSEEVERQLSKKITDLSTLDIAYNRVETSLVAMYNAIPKSPKIPYLTRQLETLAIRRNLSVSRLDFQSIELYPGKKVNTPIYSFTFGLNLIGQESDINDFITDLISFDRLVSIDSITTGKVEGSTNNFGTTIVGRIYYYN